MDMKFARRGIVVNGVEKNPMQMTPAELAAVKKQQEAMMSVKGQSPWKNGTNRAQRRRQAKAAKAKYKKDQKYAERQAAKEGKDPKGATLLYLCDPQKNKLCKKTSCYINGGPCKATKNLEYAKQPVEEVHMVFPMSEKEARELGVL